MVDLLPEDYYIVEESSIVVIPEFKIVLHPLSEEAKKLKKFNKQKKSLQKK